MRIVTRIAVALALFGSLWGQSDSLKVGDPAPDFQLRDQNGETVRLSQFRGSKNVVLAFYVLAFTGG